MSDSNNTLVEDLSERKYWDIERKGSFYVVTTRMQYDKETCERIINLIIRAFEMNLKDELQQESKQAIEIVKKLEELIEAGQQSTNHVKFCQCSDQTCQDLLMLRKLKGERNENYR